jgi:hypothetical protein
VCRERERSNQTRCCSRDGGRPSEAGLQEQASNNRKRNQRVSPVPVHMKRYLVMASRAIPVDVRRIENHLRPVLLLYGRLLQSLLLLLAMQECL